MFFKKKKPNRPTVAQLIEKDGIDQTAFGFAGAVNDLIPNKKIAYLFILEEVEAASKGNAAAKAFALNSQIPPSEYVGAAERSIPEVDGPGGPQQMVLAVCGQLLSDPDSMVSLRVKIAEIIMQTYSLGKYSIDLKIEPDPLSNRKTKSENSDLSNMVCGYARLEVQKISGIDPNSPDFDEYVGSVHKSMDPFLDAMAAAPDNNSTKKIMYAIADTMEKVPGDRHQEMMGDLLIVFWLRMGLSQHALQNGSISKKEADMDFVLSKVHNEAKSVINQFG